MHFTLNDDQQAFQSLAADFSQKELTPYAAQWDEESYFPIETFKKAAALGFGGLYVKDDVGGSNLSRLDSTLIVEALAKGCVSTTSFITIHNMVAWVIDTFGNEDQRQNVLPTMVTMDQLGSYCLTEPTSGSDAASLKTTAKKVGGDYVLNGTKAFISGAGESSYYLTMVRTGDASHKGISCVLVPKDAPGLSFGKKEIKMGWNSQPTRMVIFEDCKVPETALIGQEGDGFKIAMTALDGGRVNIAACSLGGAAAALSAAKEQLKVREQFGQTLEHFQGLQFRFADLATTHKAAQLMTYQAADAIDQNNPEKTKLCAMAKRFTTDECFKIADGALQLFGGYGYLREYPMERIFRDLRVHSILEGTNEIMRIIIAKHLLKE